MSATHALASAPLGDTGTVPAPIIQFAAADGLSASDSTFSKITAVSNDSASSLDVVSYSLCALLIERAMAADAVTSSGTFGLSSTSTARAMDAAGIAYLMLSVDLVTAQDSVAEAHRRIVAVADILRATDIASNKLQAVYQIASALAAADVAAFVTRENIDDAAIVGELVAHSLRTYTKIVEAALAADEASVRSRFLILADDGATIVDSGSSTATLLQAVEDGALVLASLVIEDTRYLAWVVNAKTRAAWPYSHFGFTSFAKFGDHYYGAKHDGIFLLEGDSDAGVPIKAMLHTGPFDFGSPNIKRLPMIYVAATRSGELIFKVLITTEKDTQEAHWYRVDGGATTRLRQDRVKPDKGLETMEFEFELVNVAGADFDIDSLKLLPMITSRRI